MGRQDSNAFTLDDSLAERARDLGINISAARASLTTRVGTVSDHTMKKVCAAISDALGC